MKKLFELLNRLNHTPSMSNYKLDSHIRHRERTNAVLTSPNGKKIHIGKSDEDIHSARD